MLRAFQPRVALLVLVVAMGCSPGPHIPAPSIGRAAPLPPIAPAVMVLPVTIPLATVRMQLDSAFPASDSLDRARCAVLGGAVCHQYVYRRQPLDVTMQDDRFSLAVQLRYRGRMDIGRLATLGSCGYAPQEMRRAQMRFSTWLYWRSDWRLGSRGTTLAAELVDACRVTALNVDATSLMRRVLDAQLRQLTRMADSLIPALADLRPVADSLWTAFLEPIALDSAESTWLQMNVEGVSLAPVAGAGGALRTAVVVTAYPRVVLGDRPASRARPLPALTLAAPASGLTIPVDVQLPYDALARRAAALLAPDAAARGIEIRRIGIWGAGDTLVVRLETAGKLAGTTYLVGRIGYDAPSRSVRVDDLRYTIESESRLTQLKVTLGAPLIRRALDQATSGGRLHVGAQLDSARLELDHVLNGEIAPGMVVGGGISEVRIDGVHLTADAIVVRVRLAGSAQLIVQ